MEESKASYPGKIGYQYFQKAVNQAYQRKYMYHDPFFIFSHFSTLCSQKWHSLSDNERNSLHQDPQAVQEIKLKMMEKAKRSAECQDVAGQPPNTKKAKAKKVSHTKSVEEVDLDPAFKEVASTMKKNLGKDLAELKHWMREEHVVCSGSNERVALRAAINEYTEEGLRDLIEKAGHTKNIPGDYVYKMEHTRRKYLVEFCDAIMYGVLCEAGLCVAKGKPKSRKHLGWFPTPKLQCKKCNKLFPNSSKAEQHLDTCWFDESKEGEAIDVIYLEATAFDEIMRFDVILPIDATFKDLDKVLRDVWMEVEEGHNMHLSQFHYDKLARPNYVPNDFNDMNSRRIDPRDELTVCVALYESKKKRNEFEFEDKSVDSDSSDSRDLDSTVKNYKNCFGDRHTSCGRDAPLTLALTNHDQILQYTYDLGDSLHANVKYRGIRKFKPSTAFLKTGAVILQNEALKIPCSSCDKPAEFITSGWPIIGYPDEEVFCSKECATCAQGAELCKIVNTPRCGFSGFHYDCTIRNEDDSDYELWMYN